jgi:hypothetical protein
VGRVSKHIDGLMRTARQHAEDFKTGRCMDECHCHACVWWAAMTSPEAIAKREALYKNGPVKKRSKPGIKPSKKEAAKEVAVDWRKLVPETAIPYRCEHCGGAHESNLCWTTSREHVRPNQQTQEAKETDRAV